jgi:hypothetical protein
MCNSGMARSSGTPGAPTPTERTLAVELTALAVARAAPDELVLLEETAEEYFADPGALARAQDGDTPLGSGIDVAMMTPYLLAASSAVLPVLGTIAGDLGKDVAKEVLTEPAVSWIRRLFRRGPAEPPGDAALTPEQAARVRDAVVAQCLALGLDPQHAALVADATIGSLHVRA